MELRNQEFLGCGTNGSRISGDEAGVWIFLVCYREVNKYRCMEFFLARAAVSRDFRRGFPGMELQLEISRVAKSAGGGRVVKLVSPGQ